MQKSACNAGDLGSIPGPGRFPGEGNGNPLQYSCLENPMDGGVHGRLQFMGSLGVGHDWRTSLSRIGEGNGNPLQCSCLENPRDGGAWWAAIYGAAQSRTRLKQLSSSSSSSPLLSITLQDSIHLSWGHHRINPCDLNCPQLISKGPQLPFWHDQIPEWSWFFFFAFLSLKKD